MPGLKAALLERGLATRGTKELLVLRLEAAVEVEEGATSRPDVRPGIAGIDDVATAEVSALLSCIQPLV